MADVIFFAVLLAFFGLCVLLVKACDRMIGSDNAVPVESVDVDTSADTGAKAA